MILDQHGNPWKAEKKPDGSPLAAAPILESNREYVTVGLTPAMLAAYFRSADSGDIAQQAHLYEQICERDGHLLGETGKRKNVITDVEFAIEPADDSGKAVEISEFCEEILSGLEEWPDVLVLLQDAVGKGFSCAEIRWDLSSGQAVPHDFEQVASWRFRFFGPDGYLMRFPRLLTDDNIEGIEIPAWKTLFHRHNALSGNATRNGVYRVCAWMFLFKNYAIKDWLVFAEVYGMPLRIGKYDPGASSDDKTALKRAISAIGSDAAGIISRSTEIEFIESIKGRDGGELFHKLTKFADKEMSKALLGATLTADVGDVGSYAASQTHNEVRLDLVKADSRAIAATVRNQLLRPLVGFNFGWDQPCPKYRAVWDEDEDLGRKAEWVEKIIKTVQVPAKWLREQFKIPEPEEGEEIVGGAPESPFAAFPAKQRPAKPGAKTAVAAGPDLPDQWVDRLADQARPVFDDHMSKIEGLLSSVSSLEEFRDRLIDLYPDLDHAKMATLMARAAAAIRLAGRYEVAEEAGATGDGDGNA